jgi:MFS family permease
MLDDTPDGDSHAPVTESPTGARDQSRRPVEPPAVLPADADAMAPLTVSPAEPSATVPPVETSGVRRSVRAFRHRNFTIFWCGALVSNTGSWLQNLTVPYVLYELTGSAFWVSLATVSQFAPAVLLGPLGGSLADRYERRRILLVTQSSMAFVALLLWGVWATGLRDPVVVLALVGLTGVVFGMNMPSWQSFVSDLVPREDLISAVTLNSLQFNAARSLGPGIAGLLLAAFGPAWAFLINALSFLVVLAALAAVRPGRRPIPAGVRQPVHRQFRDAIAYCRRQPGILMALLATVAVATLGNPIFQFTVVFAGSELHVGPAGLGMLNAAFGAGAVLAAPVVSGSRRLSRAQTVRWGLLLYGLGIVGFGLAPSFGLALVSLVLVGGAFLAVLSASQTAVQIIVAERLRGRVLALRIMVFTGTTPIGALLQGWLADHVGPRPTVVGAGVLLLVVAVVLARFRGRLRMSRLDDLPDETPGAAVAV